MTAPAPRLAVRLYRELQDRVRKCLACGSMDVCGPCGDAMDRMRRLENEYNYESLVNN